MQVKETKTIQRRLSCDEWNLFQSLSHAFCSPLIVCGMSLLLQELLAKGNQWTKEMEMRLTDTDVVLLDGETQVRVERKPLQGPCQTQLIVDKSF